MSKHSELAKELYRKGYNCSQSVFAAFCDETGLSFEDALKISSSFGGGMGRLKEVCGALTGMFMAAGMQYGSVDPADKEKKEAHYDRIRSLAEQFKDQNKSMLCRELLERYPKGQNPAGEMTGDDKYPCMAFIEHAAQILDDYIEAKEREGKQTMKIAVASEGKNVTEHFGHCVDFNLYDIENGKIVHEESIPNPGHKPGFLPNFLADRGVTVIISGGMGGGAGDICKERNIEVVVGASGDAKTAVESYLKGDLKTTGTVCHEQQHHGTCGK